MCIFFIFLASGEENLCTRALHLAVLCIFIFAVEHETLHDIAVQQCVLPPFRFNIANRVVPFFFFVYTKLITRNSFETFFFPAHSSQHKITRDHFSLALDFSSLYATCELKVSFDFDFRRRFSRAKLCYNCTN